MKNILVTGGAGFIGSNFIRILLSERDDVKVINFDKLTYAGNPENLKDVENDSRYKFVLGDICDYVKVQETIGRYKIDTIVNFAAESHVDRSIMGAVDFIKTDVEGVYVLLECVRNTGIEKFIQISTDEVYGSVEKGYSKETDTLMPRNPYSASKAGGDRLAYSFYATYGMPVIITRASNNYGPYQYPEKLIPLFVTNAMENKNVPLYGDGLNIRDWLYVEDHCRAILFLLDKGKNGEIYNIGGGNLHTNIEITKLILKLAGKTESLISPVKDRLGHDRRYALDSSKLEMIGWKPLMSFEEGIEKTVKWYIDNKEWWMKLKNKDFDNYYKKQYIEREKK
ncbi:dTDP-glucose 4,6-dehydratase [Candidatus Dependentiae bacterium]|nr:dTDP-glucose 4,6-dehydratase [Candidatus Dependentiae bacterium]